MRIGPQRMPITCIDDTLYHTVIFGAVGWKYRLAKSRASGWRVPEHRHCAGILWKRLHCEGCTSFLRIFVLTKNRCRVIWLVVRLNKKVSIP